MVVDKQVTYFPQRQSSSTSASKRALKALNSSRLRLMHHHSSSTSTLSRMRLRISAIILSTLETGRPTVDDGVGELGDAVSGGVTG